MTLPRSLPIPAEVLRIARKLADAGFDVWCVGGAVRDNLLGVENKDFDLATSATPGEVQRLFRRTVPLGVEHGTVAVLDRYRKPHEVTTFRKDVATDGRHATVAFGVSLDEDLARRDFTVNAIAYHPLTHEWRDPFGGQADLEAKLLRAVGDPAARFREDYLRILRLLRFAARFGFVIDPATWTAAQANAGGLRHLSAERVREEWMRGLAGARAPSELVRLWCEIGAAEILVPEVRCALSAGVLEEDRTRAAQQLPTTAHSPQRTAVDRLSPRDPILLTSFLSSDPAATLARLRCSNAEIERGRAIGTHRGSEPSPEDPVAVRRWMSAVGPVAGDLVAIAKAEGRGDRLAAAVRAVRASKAPLSIGDLAVNGQDLMSAGVPEGPKVGETLRRLLEAVLEDPALNARETLLKMVIRGTLPASRFPLPAGEDVGRGKGDQ